MLEKNRTVETRAEAAKGQSRPEEKAAEKRAVKKRRAMKAGRGGGNKIAENRNTKKR